MRRALMHFALASTLVASATALELGGGLPLETGALSGGAREITRGVNGAIDPPAHEVRRLVRETRRGVRDIVGRPILGDRESARLIERLPDGTRSVRGEILATSPSRDSEALWESAGLDVARRESLDSLGIEIVVLTAEDGETGQNALNRIRSIDPTGVYDLNHLYDPSGGAPSDATQLKPASAPCEGCRIGVIDSGADTSHADLRRARIDMRGFAGPASLPSRHGTAIASLLVGRSGAAHGAHLFLADIYSGETLGGSAEAIIRALAWLASEDTPVISISIAGPPNAALEAAIATMTARGHILVAAVGNGGPAAPAAYPAGYPEVIGVTAIDGSGRTPFDAQRGPQVDFAAFGVNLTAAAFGGGEAPMTGTSFATPRVAARASAMAPKVSPVVAEATLSALRAQAIDMGDPGKDDVYGFGVLEPLGMAAAPPN